jgi:hypothetical protein
MTQDLCKCGHDKTEHYCYNGICLECAPNEDFCIKFIPAPVDAKGKQDFSHTTKSDILVGQSSQIPQEHSPLYSATEIYVAMKQETSLVKSIDYIGKQFLDAEKVKEAINDIEQFFIADFGQTDWSPTFFRIHLNLMRRELGLEEAKR